VFLGRQSIQPKEDVRSFLCSELQTSRIDNILKHLWFAGIKCPARPLHRQLILQRQLIQTEDINKHLVTHDSAIFIKPLPDYLLNREFWEKYLCDDDLYPQALGLLLSYSWLIQFKSDFLIAKENHLIPESLETWAHWVTTMDDTVNQIQSPSAPEVHSRYEYGELRLKALNRIYKLQLSTFSLSKAVNGFMRRSILSGRFVSRNVTCLLALFAFFSLMLSAFQVGLGTADLQKNKTFNKVAVIFSLISIFVVVFSFFIIALASIMLPIYYTIRSKRLEGYADNEP